MNAPVEFAEIGLDPHAFTKSDRSKTWRGPCPACGGKRRFLIFTNNPWPLWNGQCDQCGYQIKAWTKVRVPVDPQILAAHEAEQAREDAERTERRRAKLADFTSHELWLELSERMERQNVAWWEAQGIPEALQRELKLGYIADKPYKADEELYHSPAYTIPWFGYGYDFKTMQYRLTQPHDPADKYRFEQDLPGGGSLYYMATPKEKIGDKVIICEGAKKAIVTWFWLAMDYTVIGTASNKTLRPALEATKDCGERILILDPDSAKVAWDTVKANKNMKALFLNEKIDDMYLKYGLDRDAFTSLISQARRARN